MPSILALATVLTILTSLAATRLVRDYTRRRCLLDHPNVRSAHATPMPRLGGIAVLVPFLFSGAAWLFVRADGPVWPVLLLLVATASIAALGLVDDIWPLPAKWRFAVRALAATAIMLWRGPASARPCRLSVASSLTQYSRSAQSFGSSGPPTSATSWMESTVLPADRR
jgi:UDP-N-acetylmuramyl pentapeptide phosphotransferase/UDP-N-acetylglucosamine-1-phosphate transferase